MSNRMSVLSRRLERFAVGFTVATFACFLVGLYAASKSESQLLFLLAGLASVCLFATFFLWVAHGFAWALIPEEPVASKRPAEAWKPAEDMKPAETLKPVQALKPAETMKPTEMMKPAETIKPVEAMKTAEPLKPAETIKHVEPIKPAEAMKPLEEKQIAEEDPPDAQYTITGRRIY